MRIAWLVFAGQYVCLDKPKAFRHHIGMCLMQDGATSHIAHTTLSLLQAHALAILNPISKSNWDVIGRGVWRRGLANVRRFTCTAILMDGCNGITQRMLNVWGTCM